MTSRQTLPEALIADTSYIERRISELQEFVAENQVSTHGDPAWSVGELCMQAGAAAEYQWQESINAVQGIIQILGCDIGRTPMATYEQLRAQQRRFGKTVVLFVKVQERALSKGLIKDRQLFSDAVVLDYLSQEFRKINGIASLLSVEENTKANNAHPLIKMGSEQVAALYSDFTEQGLTRVHIWGKLRQQRKPRRALEQDVAQIASLHQEFGDHPYATRHNIEKVAMSNSNPRDSLLQKIELYNNLLDEFKDEPYITPSVVGHAVRGVKNPRDRLARDCRKYTDLQTLFADDPYVGPREIRKALRDHTNPIQILRAKSKLYQDLLEHFSSDLFAWPSIIRSIVMQNKDPLGSLERMSKKFHELVGIYLDDKYIGLTEIRHAVSESKDPELLLNRQRALMVELTSRYPDIQTGVIRTVARVYGREKSDTQLSRLHEQSKHLMHMFGCSSAAAQWIAMASSGSDKKAKQRYENFKQWSDIRYMKSLNYTFGDSTRSLEDVMPDFSSAPEEVLFGESASAEEELAAVLSVTTISSAQKEALLCYFNNEDPREVAELLDVGIDEVDSVIEKLLEAIRVNQ